MIPSGSAKCGFSYIGLAETAASARRKVRGPFNLKSNRVYAALGVLKKKCVSGPIYEQKRAPNRMRVSGQLLSVRRTTRTSRVLDFTWGTSML
jgi:hypothetical protein